MHALHGEQRQRHRLLRIRRDPRVVEAAHGDGREAGGEGGHEGAVVGAAAGDEDLGEGGAREDESAVREGDGLGSEGHAGRKVGKHPVVGVQEGNLDAHGRLLPVRRRHDLPEASVVDLVGHGVERDLGRLLFGQLREVRLVDVRADVQRRELDDRRDRPARSSPGRRGPEGRDRLADERALGGDHAREGSPDDRVIEQRLDIPDPRTRGRLAGDRRVQRRLRCEALIEEALLSVQLGLSVDPVRLGLGQLRIQVGRVQTRDDVPLLDLGPLRHVELRDARGNLGREVRLALGLDVAGRGENRHRLALGHHRGRDDLDFLGAQAPAGERVGRQARGDDQYGAEQEPSPGPAPVFRLAPDSQGR